MVPAVAGALVLMVNVGPADASVAAGRRADSVTAQVSKAPAWPSGVHVTEPTPVPAVVEVAVTPELESEGCVRERMA